MRNNLWTPPEDAILREAIEHNWTATKLLARLPGRHLHSIKNRAYKLGLKLRLSHEPQADNARAKPWTPEEDALLIPYLAKGTCRRIAASKIKILGRSTDAIEARYRRLRELQRGQYPIRYYSTGPKEAKAPASAPTRSFPAVERGQDPLHHRLIALFRRQAERDAVDVTTAMLALNYGRQAAARFAAQRNAAA